MDAKVNGQCRPSPQPRQPSSPYILLKCKISYKVDQSLIYEQFLAFKLESDVAISVSPILAALPKHRLSDTREVRSSLLSQRLMADDGRDFVLYENPGLG